MYYDLPFFYVYNADALTDGVSYNDLAVPLIDGSDFLLRRVAGLNTVASKMRFRDAGGRNRQSLPFSMPRDYVVVPDIPYPPVAQIAFDLQGVARANWPYAAGGSVPNYYSQLAFQGVRRFYGRQAPETKYPYYLRPYAIVHELTVSWTGRQAPAYQTLDTLRQFVVPVDDYDFELWKITIGITKNGGSYQQANAAVKIRLYDADEQALMTEPVTDFYLSENNGQYNSCFPCPTLVYPASSVIRLDVQSLLIESEVPATLRLEFYGAWRYPSCS